MVIGAMMTKEEARAQVDKYCESYMKLIPNSEKHAANVDKTQFPEIEKYLQRSSGRARLRRRKRVERSMAEG